MENIYRDIATRTGGNIYIGVVGPVRTGKSTLIKRIMELLVIPQIQDPYRAQRAKDELPQSGSGKTIMTSEPKFVPEEAVRICPEGTWELRVRMIDSVGYMINGAAGAYEDGQVRMVTTPWFDHEVPMTDAAELGTRKVMEEHCSIGLVVTTDGTITDIPRQDYVEAEQRAIRDMQATKKPFLVIINSREPNGETAKAVKDQLRQQFGVDAAIADCQAMEENAVHQLLTQLLYAFPMQQLHIHLPRWVDALESEHPVKAALYEALLLHGEKIHTLKQVPEILGNLQQLECVQALSVQKLDLATGTAICTITLPEQLFYEILSAKAGLTIENEAQLLSLLTELSAVKKEYEKVSEALASVKATGYGVVMPTATEMKLEKPELLHKNGNYGVKLRAGATSIHMIRVDIDTQINPMVGDEKQSRELLEYLKGEEPDRLWDSNIFGKSVYTLMQEGLTAKLVGIPEDVRSRFRGSLTKIVNEGATGLICLIL